MTGNDPLLIFPPLADPSQPYSSLPVLTGFLKEHGYYGVSQMDVNVDFVRHVLTAENLKKNYSKIEAHLGKLHRMGSTVERNIELGLFTKASMKAPFVIEEIDRAVKDLRNPACFQDVERLNNAKRVVNEAMEIISASAFPIKVGFSNAAVQSFNSARHLASAMAESQNPYHHFFLKNTLPKIKKLSPCAIGISITYRSQILPAATLASIIKRYLLGTPVIFGGNIASYWFKGIEADRNLFEWCDFLVAFEGETSLVRLLDAIKSGSSLEMVPNLAFRSRNGIIKTPLKMENINCLPTPDYRGLPLDRYLTPKIAFLLYTSRGCYWSRCKFCSVSASLRTGYRRRRAELIHKDIVELKRRHGARFIFFSDDCVSSATLKSLSEMLLRDGPEVYWQCETRFEKSLDYKLLKTARDAGCRNLIFGLESYSSRVLSLMDKGIRHADIKRILGLCRRLGIAFNLQFFFGFPGEKEKDAIRTAKFIRSEAHGAATFSFGIFELQKGSIIEKNPQLFNLKINKDCGPLSIKYDYSPVQAYAKIIKNQLRADLTAKAAYPHLGLGINAHTLIFLDLAGQFAMAEIHKKNRTKKLLRNNVDIMGLKVKIPARQIMKICSYSRKVETKTDRLGGGHHVYVYNYKEDRTVEVSPLIAWFLKKLDSCPVPSELFADLVKKSRDGHIRYKNKEMVRLQLEINSSLRELYRRGFLEI